LFAAIYKTTTLLNSDPEKGFFSHDIKRDEMARMSRGAIYFIFLIMILELQPKNSHYYLIKKEGMTDSAKSHPLESSANTGNTWQKRFYFESLAIFSSTEDLVSIRELFSCTSAFGKRESIHLIE
jgi:hypothetical protein